MLHLPLEVRELCSLIDILLTLVVSVHLYQTIKSYLAGNFLDEHYIYDELLTLEHPLMARFREADKAVLQFKDGANTQCAMFLYK